MVEVLPWVLLAAALMSRTRILVVLVRRGLKEVRGGVVYEGHVIRAKPTQ